MWIQMKLATILHVCPGSHLVVWANWSLSTERLHLRKWESLRPDTEYLNRVGYQGPSTVSTDRGLYNRDSLRQPSDVRIKGLHMDWLAWCRYNVTVGMMSFWCDSTIKNGMSQSADTHHSYAQHFHTCGKLAKQLLKWVYSYHSHANSLDTRNWNRLRCWYVINYLN